ncbi:uncharacterized protein Dana_GF16416, isoform B [Drosophila ananassae]|uniref:Uncharacterized protein, isoform B n=1 Tax=Drosophila ananassae TaxID=7217 RepID=A0A0P9CB22_DROAN|nr:homeobox protein MOX-2 [Drosophila ananassae]KPU80409.1 uncharacterized protein Dana_GF16416, isoform B [Drosophila ananassae]
MPQRTPSPANSEISVGSPSPPPMKAHNMKRLRLLRSPNPLENSRQKSSPVRVKSFSIADILGRGNDKDSRERKVDPPPSAIAPAPTLPAPAPLMLIHERLQPPGMIGCAPPPAAGVHPFLSPALLHSYEQRLAWDYQRQLQEHFQAQAHLLRHMSLNPAIITSEDGSSERSEHRSSSSNGSTDCCSPDQGDKQVSHESPEKGSKKIENGKATGGAAAGGDTPLDALFQLSTKNFDEEQDPATLNIFATRSNPKKKRKSRTAFTNQQIFELEKRFLYQKYLSPADRDEIASGLGLSNAQVITWFQNRRAKLKRDMEELKKDVQSVKQLPDQSADPTRPHHRHPQPQPQDRDRDNNKDKDKEDLRMLKLMTLMRYSDGKLIHPQPPQAPPPLMLPHMQYSD